MLPMRSLQQDQNRLLSSLREYDELLTLVKKRNRVVRHVSRFSGLVKTIGTDHRNRKEKKRQTEEEVGRQYKEWTGMEFASSARAAENSSRWKRIDAKSSVVPR